MDHRAGMFAARARGGQGDSGGLRRRLIGFWFVCLIDIESRNTEANDMSHRFSSGELPAYFPFLQHRILPLSRRVIWALSILGTWAAMCASVVHVHLDQAGEESSDGLSWSTAWATVQEGIEAARSGDEIWVGAGVYYENVVLPPGIRMYGGFSGSESALMERDWVWHETILDGQEAGPVIVIGEGAEPDTRLDGFIVRNGLGWQGGGIVCSNASPVIANNLIQFNIATNGAGLWLADSAAVCEGNRIIYNTATVAGGGLAITNGSVTVRSNLFLANAAWVGGAMDVGGGTALIEWNRIHENQTAFVAGGIRLIETGATVRNNRLVANVTRAIGGGLACYGAGSPLIANNLFLGNRLRLPGQGAGLFFDAASEARLVNNSILYNEPMRSTALRCEGSLVVVVNNLIAFNSTGVQAPEGISFRHNCVFGNSGNFHEFTDPTGSEGNVSVDPRLIPDEHRFSFHLGPGSPCVNAGDIGWVEPGTVDLDGQPRPWGGGVDIGAHEFTVAIEPAPWRAWRVRPGGDDRADGLSWETAKASAQAAIDAAGLEGGEVWVAEGVYVERVTLRYAVHLLGGFAGTETESEERDWRSRASILDGAEGGSVITAQYLPASNMIDGFVIRGGSALGGGIFVVHVPMRIANNTISGNVGGGLYLLPDRALFGPRPSPSTIMLTNNVIAGNRATSGAGLTCASGSVTIVNNIFLDNIAENPHGGSGGAIFLGTGATPQIRNNLFQGNVATSSSSWPGTGGAIRTTDGGQIQIVGNTFIGNRVEPDRPPGQPPLPGGAIYHELGELTLANNLMVSNSTAFHAVLPDHVAVLRHNCVYGNLFADYTGIPDPTGTDGNIRADPWFAAWPGVRLSADSPCVDAGDTGLTDRREVDLDGHARVAGAAVDIGVHEFGSARPFTLTLLPASGEFPHRLRLTGEAGKTYVFESSSELDHWTPFATNKLDGSGIEQSIDPHDVAAGEYYRAVTGP
jgi:hypothetical protein